jgi:hypothetical protein
VAGLVPPAALPPGVLDRADVREALAVQDLGRVFFLARRWAGISYAKISAVADGLRIPGHLLGLAPRWWETADVNPAHQGAGRARPGWREWTSRCRCVCCLRM